MGIGGRGAKLPAMSLSPLFYFSPVQLYFSGVGVGQFFAGFSGATLSAWPAERKSGKIPSPGKLPATDRLVRVFEMKLFSDAPIFRMLCKTSSSLVLYRHQTWHTDQLVAPPPSTPLPPFPPSTTRPILLAAKNNFKHRQYYIRRFNTLCSEFRDIYNVCHIVWINANSYFWKWHVKSSPIYIQYILNVCLSFTKLELIHKLCKFLNSYLRITDEMNLKI